MKNSKSLLYVIICVLIVLSVCLFNRVSVLKEKLTSDEICNDIAASDVFKDIEERYDAYFLDEIGIISDEDGNLYLKADNVKSVKNLYKKYNETITGLNSDGFLDWEIVPSIEAYKFNISGVKSIGEDSKNNKNIFFALLDNKTIVYISEHDILNGKVDLNVVNDLHNIDHIYEKEQGDEILGLYAVDNTNAEYKIIDYIV